MQIAWFWGKKTAIKIATTLKLLKNLFRLWGLFSPKDPVTKEERTDAIYAIPRTDCDDEYIAQNKRQFGTRLKEHQKRFSFAKKKIQIYRSTHA